MPVSTASAVWEGGLKGGKGQFNGKSGLLSGAYTFATRFESAKGTNPEELVGAAHAACYSMALSAGLEAKGKTPTRVSTTAEVTLSMDGGPHITTIRLTTRGVVPGLDQAGFAAAAEDAKKNCPISKLFANNATIELDAKLE
ncbi:MAG TPA: OsmC family peroxiredoxin [Gemmatimonadales bacterium]|nr:OsmC family peroxiredoxin [Gemmatimonadales bacterium]